MPPFLRYAPLLALLFGLFATEGSAQTLPPKISTFAPEDYGSFHQTFLVRCLPDGRVMFGTSEEVLLYNGEGFERIRVGDGKYVLSMGLDSNGVRYLGGDGLIGSLAPDRKGRMRFRSLRPHLPDSLKDMGTIWNTWVDDKGGVYFNSFERLLYWKDDTVLRIKAETKFHRFHHPSGRPVIEDSDTALFALSEGKKEKLPNSDSLVKRKGIRTILPAAQGREGVWAVFTRTEGLYHYHPEKGHVAPFPIGMEHPSMKEVRKARVYTACRLDPKENPYGAAYAVGTQLNGIYLLAPSGKILLNLDQEDGMPADNVWDLDADRYGNVWAATNDGIALLHTGIPFTIAEEGKFFKGTINDIARPSASKKRADQELPLVLSTLQGGWRWDREKGAFSLLEGSAGQTFGLLPFTFPDQRPGMLIAGGNEGLFAVRDLCSPSLQLDTLSEHQSRCLSRFEMPKGKKGVLVGGRRGVRAFSLKDGSRGGWKEVLKIPEVPQGILSLAWEPLESRGDSIRIWATTRSKGVLAWIVHGTSKGYRTLRYDTTHGIPSGPKKLYASPFEEDGGPLFETDKGIYRFEGGRFIPHSRFKEILPKRVVQLSNIEKGSDGAIWLDGSGELDGIIHLIPRSKGDYRISRKVFRAVDLGSVRSILPEEERTWIGGEKALACYFPDVATELDREWHCSVQQVKGSGDSVLFEGHFAKKPSSEQRDSAKKALERWLPVDQQPERMVPTLPYSDNRMEFSFAAAYPTRQEAVTYSYKLVGFDTAWSKWTDRARKEYTNLQEGTYTFRVKARNIYLHESSTAEYRFRILPPWYRTSTAYGGYAITGLGFLWFMLWLNSRRLVAQKERLERTVEERTKEIREQKELVEEQKDEVEKKNQALEEANETISKQKEEVEEAHQEITQSIDYAQKIQYALLQSEEHDALHLPEHFILFKPQSQVSGDFYWGQEHKGYFYIAAVDCTGHGVPGAFMSMLGISQLNEIMNTDEVPTPGDILTELRERVVRELSGNDPESAAKDGMDAAMVRIPNSNSNSKEGELEVQFAGAQNPLYVIRRGIVNEPPSASMEYQGQELEGDPVKPFKKSADGIEIKGDGQPVGYDEYAKDAFTTVELKLRKGDMCYFFSDGYADQFGGSRGKKFRYGPFKQLLTSIHQKPLEEQKEELDKSFEDWKAESNQEQIDDVVVIGVRL